MAIDTQEHLSSDNPFQQLTLIVYRQIFGRIQSCQMKPCEKINITQLSDEMNTSRTPVFEALKQLETIGFVERRNGQNGWYVSRLNKENAIELCVARATIEKEAAFLCAQQDKCSHLAEMASLAKKYKDLMISGGNCELTESVDTSFHKLLVEACGNKYLLRSYEDVAKGLVRYQFHAKRSIMADTGNKLRQAVATQHLSIVNAVRLNMPEFARNEMENHMNTCTAIILSSIDDIR